MSNIPDNWYRISNIDELDSPALVVYPDRVKANISTAIGMVGDVSRLRPHIKTHKSPDTAQLMMVAGISKFKCATIAEAEMLAMANAGDVLLAYQPTGPKLKRFAELIKKYPATRFSCLVDNTNSAKEQSGVFHSYGLQIPVYLDLNIGMNRTGIAPGEAALELYLSCASLPGITPVGLHAYDGHIRGIDFNERRKECDNAFAPVLALKKQLIQKGMNEPIIIAGGSHTFPIHCERKDVECSPGTFVYWDKNNSYYCPEQPFLPAALVVTRVVSLPSAGKLCVDLGHKSVAAENEITNRVYFLNAPDLVALSQSEEHLVLSVTEPHNWQPGDVLYGLPIHICPTVALYESMTTIENSFTTGQWSNIARNRKISL